MEKNDKRKDASTHRIWLFILAPKEYTAAYECGSNTNSGNDPPRGQPSVEPLAACRQLFIISRARTHEEVAIFPLWAQSNNT